MPTSTINGVQLFWERTGDSGEPLVLVHGSWVDHHTWDAVVPSLAQSFRVLTYDRRGHSQSERSAAQGSIRDDVADLAALIEALDLAPAHIAGSSLGGSIALRLAGERPDLFRSLIVNEPPMVSLLANEPQAQPMLQAINERFATVAQRIEAGDMEGGARTFVEEIVFGPGAWAQLPPELKQIVIFNAPTFLDELHDPDAFSIDLARLRRFPHPTLLTVSENGPPFMPPIIAKLAEVLPQAEHKLYEGATHEPEASQPQAYVATVTDFAQRASRSQKNPSA